MYRGDVFPNMFVETSNFEATLWWNWSFFMPLAVLFSPN
jgi:hypothetical protein